MQTTGTKHMNITHWRYALEVERTHSISKAAKNLFMGQPNISRAIKELEAELGFTLFERTRQGMVATTQGEEFLRRAARILLQIDEMETLYQGPGMQKQVFSISVPRASYISCAFSDFVRVLTPTPQTSIYYKETNALRALDNLEKQSFSLAIIRYQAGFEPHFKALLREKRFASEPVFEFAYRLAFAPNHPLASLPEIRLTDLSPYTEIAHADPYVPTLSLLDAQKAERSAAVNGHIYIYERGSQYDLLQHVPGTFMWVSPTPSRLLAQYGLIERGCVNHRRLYRDALVWPMGYRFTDLDHSFLDALTAVKAELENQPPKE